MEYSGEENLNVMKLAQNYNDSLIELVMRSIPKTADQIVDFGSGEGFFSLALSEKLHCEIINIEPAENMFKYYQTRPFSSLEELQEQGNFSIAVDFIYSLNVLEHIENDSSVIEEFFKVLKHGGEVLLYLPAFPVLYSSMDKKVGHYRRYTKKDVARLFPSTKWQTEDVRYADFIGWLVSLLFKFIGNREGQLSPISLKIYDKLIFPLSKMLDKISRGKICGKNIIIKARKK